MDQVQLTEDGKGGEGQCGEFLWDAVVVDLRIIAAFNAGHACQLSTVSRPQVHECQHAREHPISSPYWSDSILAGIVGH